MVFSYNTTSRNNQKRSDRPGSFIHINNHYYWDGEGNTMFCAHCGSRLEEDARYCHSCGAPAKGTISENPFKSNTDHSFARQSVVASERDESKGTVYIVLGWVFFGLSFFIVPILFGAGAFIMGYLTYRVRSQTHGVVLMVLAVVGAVLGMLIGYIVTASMYL